MFKRKAGKTLTSALAVLAMASVIPFDLARAQDSEAMRSSAGNPLGATMTGNTSRSDGTGWIEARLLSGLLVKEVARRIVDAIGVDFTSLTIVVLPMPKEADNTSSMVGGKGWDVLESADKLPVVEDMIWVRERLSWFTQQHAAIASAGAKSCRASADSGGRNKSIRGEWESIAPTLQAASPLINLFKQDFTYSGLKVKVREGMLVTAVRGEIAARRKPSANAASGGAETMHEAVEIVGHLIADLPAQARCGAGDGGAESARLVLVDKFAAFRNELSGPARAPGMTLLAAADDQLRRFGARPATLVLAIDADGASMVERKNLLTMFGAESTTVSSGIVVSYEFYEPQSGGIGSLKAAGVLSCMSGAAGIRAIHNAKQIRSRATCF